MGNARSKMHHGFEDELTQMIEGVAQFLPADTTLVVLGETWDQPALLDALRSSKKLMVAVRDAQNQVLRARQAVDDDVPRAHALLTALSAALQGYFGKQHPNLPQFGVPSGTRAPITGAVRVRAAAKAKLTRQLRHTLGSRQRLALVAKGPITVTLFAPDGRVISSTGPKPSSDASPSIKTP
jgi:hypothetical protein